MESDDNRSVIDDHVVEIMRIAVIFIVVVDAGCIFVVVFVVVVVA
jgi:hypothetical protein